VADGDFEKTGDRWGGASLEAGFAAVGAVLGTALAGPLGAAGGAVLGSAVAPWGVAATEQIGLAWAARRQRNAAVAATITAAELDVDGEGLTALATSTPGALQLSAEAFIAAANTVSEAKIKALAMALAEGLADDGAQLDEELQVVRALAAVEEPHIAVLGMFDRESWSSPGRTVTLAIADLEKGLGERRGLAGGLVATLEGAGLLLREQPDLSSILRQMEQRESASRTGLVTAFGMSATLPPPRWAITGLGELVMRYLGKPERTAMGYGDR
jgi:hypothetical protein